MDKNTYGLQPHVDYLYENQPRRLAFDTIAPTNATAFAAWQRELRRKVVELLRLTDRETPASVHGEMVQAVERDGYAEEKHILDGGEGVEIPVYILVPHREPPFRPITVFHGHNPSVQYVLGNYPDEETAREKRALDNNYAQALAQAGYLVCAVEQRGFGERQSHRSHGAPDGACRHLSFEYMMDGRNLLGERCWDGMCAITYVKMRDDVVPDAMGCTGNSGGGTTTLWLSAIDRRITVSVPSCYFCSFKASIMSLFHCECNYVPGIVQYAEMGDLAALIAPRAFRAIAGEQDGIFPVDAVREQFETVRRAYALVGEKEKCSLAIHPGPHAYNHASSHEWFGTWL